MPTAQERDRCCSPPQVAPHDTGNLRVAFFLNLGFTLVELIGGVLTNSLAILSDALHDLGDSLSLGLTWYLDKLARRARTQRYTFGYRRFSLLGAVTNSLLLLVGAAMVLWRAIPRLFAPHPVHTGGMLALAVLGVVVNGAAAWRLHKGERLSERVAMLHLLEDVLGWAAVLVASVVMHFTNALFLDPALSVAITLFVVWRVWINLARAAGIFLQSVPEAVDLEGLERAVRKVPGVCSVHDLHVWSMDGQYNVLTLHAVVAPGTTAEEMLRIKQECRRVLGLQNVHHSTIEIETSDECCGLQGC
ncbi:MAG: cation diffusion facilitator family transporter [candidate division KSB1 bacterium]|nr:cation diffusion facilitator family transporter [candidate division KSB1 bacterium]MDZ7378232.1 cation diffusion facilitator family transporter [candidate division KSB1 bacterium]MDZ7391381.1 cation diffusion facilitator family transporter [candidate division KSB1 bacterium]MDZ7412336.1 cation diffusion facilitator family transporter [candidate division KSB1 bacterium]